MSKVSAEMGDPFVLNQATQANSTWPSLRGQVKISTGNGADPL